MARRLTRRGRLIRTAVVLVLLAVAATYVVVLTPVGTLLGLRTGPPCTLTIGDESVDWSTEQAQTATTVAGVGTRIGATSNGVAEAVARSLVALEAEDSATVVDAATARATYRALPDVAEPDEQSSRIARSLLGYDGDVLTCVLPLAQGSLPTEKMQPDGLTPRADEVRAQLRTVFGKQSLGGFARGGITTGHIKGSAHYEGRAIDVFFRPVTQENTRRGWQEALWTVAHAERLGLATVIFDRRIWTPARSLEGWRDYRYPGGTTENPILLHEDHVHVDVSRGR